MRKIDAGRDEQNSMPGYVFCSRNHEDRDDGGNGGCHQRELHFDQALGVEGMRLAFSS